MMTRCVCLLALVYAAGCGGSSAEVHLPGADAEACQ